MECKRVLTSLRVWLLIFIIGLILSGITAFPLQAEIILLHRWVHDPAFAWLVWPGLTGWIDYVHGGLLASGQAYPFLAYGTDWLAFAHLVIAVAFIGPLRDPVRNIWVLEFGMIACILVFPLAMIAGPIRGIPFFWQLIDCSFGVVGFILLLICRKLTLRYQALLES